MKNHQSPIKIINALIVMSLFFTSCASLQIVGPGSNEVVNSLEPTFTWKYTEKPDIAYELKIAEDQALLTNVKLFKIPDKTDFKLTIPYLKEGKKYYWTVRARYFDKKAGDFIYSEWVYKDKKSKTPFLFTTSQNAKGEDRLEEGQQEEVNLSGIVENVTRLTFDDNNEWSPVVSMDGAKLAFVSNRTKNAEIFVKDLEHGGAGEMQRTFSAKGQQNQNPFWLNDNNNVCFYSNRLDKQNWHLFSTTKGKGLTLISSSFSLIEPQWLFGSASETNGNLIFSVKTKTNPQPTLWLFQSETNRFTQLVPGFFPDIRKDKIVYCSEISGNYDIWMLDLEENSVFNETQLTYHEGWDFDPALSPDGTKIAYVSHRSGNSDIWIMDIDGTHEMQLTFHPMADRRPQWVDNNTIIFQSNREPAKDDKPGWDIWEIKY